MAQPSKPDTRPTVLHPIELAAFVRHVLHRIRHPVHLIICSSQGEFLRQLLASIAHEKDIARQEAEASGLVPHKIERLAKRGHDLFIPTLRQLASASDVKVTFCETLPQLQAYLSVYHFNTQPSAHEDSISACRTIALINPISLHRNISSFSTQGFSRTFATAVEAASRVKAKLLIVECPSRAAPLTVEHGQGFDDFMHEQESDHGEHQLARQEDPWEEQVSILNVTTKSFGAGERGWVGRAMKIRSVAERWCVFQRPGT